ncbi:hypothetical protein AB0N62_44630 [Streptomyces sp. NPDC093982]|uniref:hypothetical protein n=1 Tax=Streptomyces sp. NPDC093982 TaxID=3155077 RepID=UPI003417BB47
MSDGDLPSLVDEVGRSLGLSSALVYVAALQQIQSGRVALHHPRGRRVLDINRSLGGLVYRT